jgi:hypothetical protein
MPHDFRTGQRWISETEPELGLGSVLRVNSRTVVITFGASEETREYARDNAPLRRVRFRIGDAVGSERDKATTVQSVIDRNGILFYGCEGGEICETELSAAISFNKPGERLLAGQIDPPDLFDLRVAALRHQHGRRKSRVRGFVGGRIELIPHQLYIASEVARRLVPRVLLADEVGLGKTIEACLILHRLILTGRVQRALILVPDSPEAEPPLDPPALCATFHGERQGPKRVGSVVPVMPNSGVLVLPRNTSPAARKRAVRGPSASAGSADAKRLPPLAGIPWTGQPRSLTRKGTPRNGPSGKGPDAACRASSKAR